MRLTCNNHDVARISLEVEVSKMNGMLRSFYAKPFVLYLVAALLAFSTFAQSAEAMFLPVAPHQDISNAAPMSTVRIADLDGIRTALESKIVLQTLLDYGLSREDAMSRINTLTDEQINQFATHTESLQAGGQVGAVIVVLLVVAVLVVFLVFALISKVL